MKKSFVLGLALLSANAAFAQAPNRADTSQLGTVLGFPYVALQDTTKTTVVRITNTGNTLISLRCELGLNGSSSGVFNVYPLAAKGTLTLDLSDEFGFGAGFEGMLFCWPLNLAGTRVIKWNYLSGSATIVDSVDSGVKWEYSAWAFAARAVVADGAVIPGATAGLIPLDGVRFDKCPEYLIGQYSPSTTTAVSGPGTANFSGGRFAAVPCNVDFRNLSMPTILGPAPTSLGTVTLTILNEQGVANTGVNVTCVGNWHEAALPIANTFGTTRTVAYRVQSNGGAFACPSLPAQGLIGVQVFRAADGANTPDHLGSTLNGAGERTGFIRFTP